jgi:hypothetical protein
MHAGIGPPHTNTHNAAKNYCNRHAWSHCQAAHAWPYERVRCLQILKVFRPPPNPPISEFIQPELKLAGLRIDAAQCSRARLGHSLGMSLLHYDLASTTEFISDLPEIALKGVPPDRVFNYIRWSPNGVRIAFTLRHLGNERAPLELYVADIPEKGSNSAPGTAEFTARPILGDLRLNSILHDYDWLDDDTIVAAVIPSGRGAEPVAPTVPGGPKISDNSSGKKSQARTYPDLLKVCASLRLYWPRYLTSWSMVLLCHSSDFGCS